MSEEKKQSIESMELFPKKEEEKKPVLPLVSAILAVILLVSAAICVVLGLQAFNSYSRSAEGSFYMGIAVSGAVCGVVVWTIGSIYAVLCRIEKVMEGLAQTLKAEEKKKE